MTILPWAETPRGQGDYAEVIPENVDMSEFESEDVGKIVAASAGDGHSLFLTLGKFTLALKT